MFPNVEGDGAESTRVGSPSFSDKEKTRIAPPGPRSQTNFTLVPRAGGKSDSGETGQRRGGTRIDGYVYLQRRANPREGTLQRSSQLWGLSEQKTPPTPTCDDFTQASPRMTLRSPARPGRCHRHRQGGRPSLGNFPEIPVCLSLSFKPPAKGLR